MSDASCLPRQEERSSADPWGEGLILGDLRKWTHAEQPPWREGVVNLERTHSGPQVWPLAEVRLSRFLEDKPKSCVFPPHLQYLDYRWEENTDAWVYLILGVSKPARVDTRGTRACRCCWGGWTWWTLEASGLGTKLSTSELGWTGQLRHNSGEPSICPSKMSSSLMFQGHFKYTVNTFGSKDLVKAIL